MIPSFKFFSSLIISISIQSRETLTMMCGSTEFMACTLKHVLSMQKIEEDKLELNMQPFALPDAVGRMLTTSFRGAAVAKALCFIQELSLRLPPRVMWDRFRVEHVLANLLSSAIKFSMQGGPIKISVEPAAEVDGTCDLLCMHACMHAKKSYLIHFSCIVVYF